MTNNATTTSHTFCFFSSPDVTTKYCYDGQQVLAEYDGSDNLLRKFIYGQESMSRYVWWMLVAQALSGYLTNILTMMGSGIPRRSR
ncbi:MAG: hypothetical protein GY774_17785 [Planctomycetes bacterium]|nr:hypothetical protein [Planctomycetota bacterium]